MIGNNWDNFLKNLGEWQGSFTQVSIEGELLDSTPSILTLEGLEDGKLVRFRVRRFADRDRKSPPVSDIHQEYRSIGRQNVFFDTGAFSKGSLQLAPFAEFGAEYGFIDKDRRCRFVQLFDRSLNFSSLILIREFRAETRSEERPQLTVPQLLGTWEGEACTAYADWKDPETFSTKLVVKDIGGGRLEQQLSFGDRSINSTAKIEGNRLYFDDKDNPRIILLLPDGASSNVPLQLKLRQAFFVESGWLLDDNHRQRLIRSYNEKGEWISATHIIERKLRFS